MENKTVKLSPWNTKMIHFGCHYWTVTNDKYGLGLLAVYDEDENNTDEYWVDVSDLTDMDNSEFEKFNNILESEFNVNTNNCGTLIQVGEQR